jgi:hypothetical protein
VILGDGFTREEETAFQEKARETADYVLDTSPYKENRDLIKFYGIFCVSEESGARGDQAVSEAEALQDSRNTFFHSSYWTSGVQRLLSLEAEEEDKAILLAKQYVPEMDYPILLVNADTYGGSGGGICVASLHEQSLEIVLHELGHTIAGLGDEYWPDDGEMAETPNTTRQEDMSLVPWADMTDQEGIGVYPLDEEHADWYKPSLDCKMQTLGQEHPFCAVCSAALEKAIALHSNADALKKSRINLPVLGAAFLVGLLAGIVGCIITRRKKK